MGGLIVNEQAYRATRQAIRYEELPALELKGKGDPVVAWHALSATSRFGVDAEAAPPTPFVGRGRELHLLQDTFERMVGEAEIQLVTITGEPGVGKTRLLAEFRTWVDDRPSSSTGGRAAASRMATASRSGRWARSSRLTRGSSSPTRPPKPRSKLGEAVAGATTPSGCRTRLGPLVGLAGDGQTRSRGVVSRLAAASSSPSPPTPARPPLRRPPLGRSARCSRSSSGSSTGRRACRFSSLCTARPELYETPCRVGRRPAQLDDGRTVAPVTRRNRTTSSPRCSRLPSCQPRLKLRCSSGQAAIRCMRRSTLRLFLEVGSAEDLPLPDTVQGIIAARLDTLPPDRKSMLQDAAVIGKVFWAGALEAMGERSHDDVREGLHQLARKELLRPARLSSVEGQTEYVVLARAHPRRRVRADPAHRTSREARGCGRLARADGRRTTSPTTPTSSLITRPRRSRWLGQPERSTTPSSSSARRSSSCSPEIGPWSSTSRPPRRATAEALELLPTGLGGARPPLLMLGRDGTAQGRFEEARVIMTKLPRASSRRSAPHASAARAYGLLGNAYFQLGGADRMRAALEHSLELLEPLPPGPEHVDTYGRMASLESSAAARRRLALEWAEKAVSLGEELGLRRELVRAYQWRGLMRCELGDLAGLEDLERCACRGNRASACRS